MARHIFDERSVPIALRGTADSQLADDLHEVVHFSVHGRLADFQMLLHADAGEKVKIISAANANALL